MFVRIGRNMAWLLGARGVAGLLSLGYLAIAARALGAGQFGVFALILAYAGTIAGLAQFKSWQAVVRFGVRHRAIGRGDDLAGLIGFTAAVDAASAVVGAMVALAGTTLVGSLLGWDARQSHFAGLFAAILLLTTGDTASGVLRLTDRFALLGLTGTIAAAVRLLGAAAVWGASGRLPWMLAVWAMAAIVESGLEWGFALTTPGIKIALGRRAWRRALKVDPTLWRFMVETSAASTLAMLWQQMGTLGVGWYGGPAAAGGFRLATKLATALVQPAEAATRALFPELAALTAGSDGVLLRTVMIRTTAIGLAVALLFVAAAATIGPALLWIVAGPAFANAQPFLVLLVVANAIDLAAMGLEPLLAAHGHTRSILRARLLGAAALLGALTIFVPLGGLRGAAAAMCAGAIVLRLYEGAASRRLLAGRSQDAPG